MSNLENYMKQQAIFCEQNDSISKNLYSEYSVKRGLRDEKGQGVLTGLTNISDIKAFEYRDGVKSPCDGELSYRGYNIKLKLRTCFLPMHLENSIPGSYSVVKVPLL